MGLVENPITETYYPLVSRCVLDPLIEHLGVLLFSMEEKRCSACGIVKPLSEFDKTKNCLDGHYSFCKECRRERSRKHEEEKRKDPAYVDEQKRKSREKYRRNKELGRVKPSNTPNGMNVARQLKRRGYDMANKEAHHWNYNLPKSVFIMSRRAHEAIHRYMYIDYETNLSYTKDGVLLETQEMAKDFFESVLKKEGIDELIEFIDYSGTPTLIESEQCRDLESFIKKARAKHGDRFKYDRAVYKGYDVPLLIGCEKHGYNWQTPCSHLRGIGCAKCASEERGKKESYTTEEFISKAKSVHGDRYTYQHAVYTGSKNRITVTCSEHGDFDVIAAFHLMGRGCDKCSKREATRKMLETNRKKKLLNK